MAQDQHIVANDASVKVVCGAGTITLSGHGNTVDFRIAVGMAEVTGAADTFQRDAEEIAALTGTYNGWWAGSHSSNVSNSQAACMMSLVVNCGACQAMLYVAPGGSTAGSLGYIACINVTGMPMSFPSDNYATMDFGFNLRAGSLTACADSIW